MGSKWFSLCWELGKETLWVEKPLFEDKWHNLFTPSNCSDLVQLCKSMSLLLRIGYFKWILTFLHTRHGKLPESNSRSATPIFGLKLQLFFPASTYFHIADSLNCAKAYIIIYMWRDVIQQFESRLIFLIRFLLDALPMLLQWFPGSDPQLLHF